MHTTLLLSFLALFSTSQAIPSKFKERQDVPPVCQLDPFNKGSWQAGGGDIFVRSWFERGCKDAAGTNCAGPHSQVNWLNDMDKATTGDGNGNSNLDCTDINSNNCNGPSVQCRYFTPYNYYYVRQMASQVHGHMKMAHEQLQNFGISAALSIDQIIADFSLPADSTPLAYKLTSSSLALAGIVFSASPIAGGVLNTLSGMFGMIGTTLKPAEPDYASLKRSMEKFIKDLFDETNNRIDRLLKRLFGENDTDSILDDVLEKMKFSGFSPDPKYIHDPISRFLSSGAFMERISESEIRTSLDAGFKEMKKGLIGHLLAGLKVHVLSNSATSESNCNGEGARYVGGACNELYILPPGSTKAEKINPNWYTKLENDYAVNLNQFYENIINCDNSDPDVQALVVGGPSCMFGINVIKTSSKGCWPACFPDNANTLPDTFKDSSTRGQGIFETCHSEICPNERLPLACSWASVKDFDQDNCHI